ncbi:MAG: hypothetical protein PHG35_08135 [Dehalococcoidales bacterium]|nr:hypothetical protein [Dehalococcoidales bacterium]
MSNTSQYVVQTLKDPFPPEMSKRYNTFAKRILWIDGDMVPGAFQMNCAWYFDKLETSMGDHIHDTDEILGFFGNDPEDPYNLHGEVEMWIGGKKHIINRTAMVFLPAGMRHCPIHIRRVDRPILHFSVVMEKNWVTKESSTPNDPDYDYSKHIVTRLDAPNFGPEFVEGYKTFATRILWMDNRLFPEAFQMNTSWYWGPKNHAPVPHTHNCDELIGFISSDFNNPNDLDAEIEMWMEDDKYLMTKSTYLFAPAGMKHCPLILHRFNRPVFHFSIVREGQYKLITAEQKND